MSQNAHYVTLLAKDEVSRQFKIMGESANASATKITTSFKSANTELARTDAATARTAASFEQFEVTAIKAGAALGAAVGVLSKLGQAADDQERQVRGIEAAYGDAADEVLRFADATQASTRFSNEQVREAATLASTLARNYGLTTAQIEELITRSADLASLHGITLPDAVQRTQSAIRGEAESAEALGLTLNDNVVAAEAARRGIEGWTTSLSESEKAQFRFTLLLEQSNFAQGQAGEAAQTAAGRAAQFGNTLQDAAVDVGSFLGPVAGATAGLADFALILPVATASVGKMVAGLAQGPATIARLVSALNPLTLGLGAASVAAGVVIKAWADNEAANAALAGSYDELTAAIRETQTAQQQVASESIRFDFPLADQIEALGGAVEDQVMGTDFVEYQKMLDRMTLSTEEQAKANKLLADAFREVATGDIDALISAMDKLETQHESFMVHGDGTIRVLEVLNTLLAYNGDGAEVVDEAVRDLNQAWGDGQITIREYANGLALLNENMPQIIADAQEAATEIEGLTKAQEDAIRSADHGAARWTAMARALDDATRSANALRSIAAQSEAGGVISFPTVASSTQAELTRIDTETRERQQAAAEDAAQIAQDLRDEQIAAAEQARDARIAAGEAYVAAEARLADEISAIDQQRRQESHDNARALAVDLRGVGRERVEGERDTVKELREIELERRELATETEEQLRDLALERGEVQAEAARTAQDAEQDWLATSRENLQAQAELRSELQRTTAEAAREWQQLNAENLAQQREIQETLQETLQGGKIDQRRELQDIGRERQRVIEDRDIALSDPNLTPEQRFNIELEAERRLEDLRVQERRAEQDFRREQKQAREDAREAEKALEEERKAAAAEFGRTQREEAEATNDRIADLEAERLAAQREFAAVQAGARDDAAQQIAALNAQEQTLLEDQAKRFAELEREKVIVARDTARERQNLEREVAHAQDIAAREAAQADRERVKALSDAQAAFSEETQRIAEELSAIDGTVELRLDRVPLDEGLAQVGEDIETLDGPLLSVMLDRKPIDTQLTEISDTAVEIMVNADLSAFRRAIREIDGDTVATVFVDVQETGAESVGGESSGRSTTAQGRGAFGGTGIGGFGATPAAPSRSNPPSVINTYGPVNLYPQSPDLHRELARRLATENR